MSNELKALAEQWEEAATRAESGARDIDGPPDKRLVLGAESRAAAYRGCAKDLRNRLASLAPDGEAVCNREVDRTRFSDAAFNEWLDTGISDAGHTVWDALGDTQAAWAGWEARQFAGDAVLLAECCGREECGGECGNEWRGMGMYRKPDTRHAPAAEQATPKAEAVARLMDGWKPISRAGAMALDATGASGPCAVLLKIDITRPGPFIRQARFDACARGFVCDSTREVLWDAIAFIQPPSSPHSRRVSDG